MSRNWARATVVGRVVGVRQAKEASGHRVEPVFSASYLRGWGESGVHDATWEQSTDPNYLLSTTRDIQGDLGMR
jgi:hypothetical protein